MKQKEQFKIKFAERLREAMLNKGYGSCSSSTGVSPTALANALSCTKTVASRYLTGIAIPDLESILKISEWLDIDTAYLAFGEAALKNIADVSNTVKIEKDLFVYFFKKFIPITKTSNNEDELIDFFVSILLDLSTLKIERDQLKHIFDETFKPTNLVIDSEKSYTKDLACKIA